MRTPDKHFTQQYRAKAMINRPIILQLDTSKLDLVLFVLARQNRMIARIAAQLDQVGGNNEQVKRLTAEVDAETKKMEDALAAFSAPPSGKSTP